MCLLSFLSKSLAVVFVLSLSVSASRSQINNVRDTTSTPIPGAGHDYVHLLSETVNPANGSVSLRIQVPTPAGRGISLPFSFSYDSSGVRDLVPAAPGSASWVANTGYFTQGGWSYALPLAYSHHWTVTTQSGGIYQSCFYISNYVFRDSSGSMHSLGVGAMYGNSNGVVSCDYYLEEHPNGGDTQVSAALVGCLNCGATSPPLVVADAAGTIYSFPLVAEGLQSGQIASASPLPAYIEDRNGNKITVSTSSPNSFTLTDTVGRAVVSSSGFGPSGTTNTLSFSGLNYQVAWKTVSASYSVPSLLVAGGSQYSCSPPPAVADSQV